jgi:hypothetical protein
MIDPPPLFYDRENGHGIVFFHSQYYSPARSH